MQLHPKCMWYVVTLFALSALPLFLHTHQPAAQTIYKWVDQNGKVHFTDRPPVQQETERVELRPLNTYTSTQVQEIDSSLVPSRKVIMYSASWCAVCNQAKQYFQRERIDFEEYDVEKSAKGKRDFKKLGGKGVPVILVGNKRLNGFSIPAFESAYEG